jgi:REP element-mobilizing transposase RayT
MANTYNQIFIHLVFAVKGRISLIMPQWKENLYKYISGIITTQKHKLYAIVGMPDHIHILVSMSPDQSISDLVRNIKRSSSLWINENHFVLGRFSWQDGYGAFSTNLATTDKVVNYILNQEQHHHKTTFQEEYIAFLKEAGIDYDPKYLFSPID